MKKIIAVLIFSFLLSDCFSQAGMWTWMKGDSLFNQAGNFGTQGVPSPSNNPPGFYEQVEWQDQQGNFWLFGGFNVGIHDDIWKFDPVTNEWTWMKGSGTTTQIPVYGTQGVASVFNTPGNQQWCAATWVDTTGNFWLFGGSDGSSSNYNLLWKYDNSTNEWTWMKGSTACCQPGVFGTAGVPDPANTPGSRWETNATWVDANGDLWLFGGLSSSGTLNDLWKYSISTNMWTWMSPSNTLSSRTAYSKWTDENGDFWLFGGGPASSNTSNDLWKYVISANQWIFVGGTQTLNDSGSYNLYCDPDTISIPSARIESRACWMDNQNNFWLFGGYNSSGNTFNDLWVYCRSGNMWTWVKGSQLPSQPAIFGMQGIPNSNNVPSSRMGSVGWKDTSGNLWLYSGWVIPGNAGNDLWKFTIDTTCGICPTSTSISANTSPNQLHIIPNPSSNELTISNFQFQAGDEIILMDVLGKIIFTKKITSPTVNCKLQTVNFTNGIYFLQLKTKEGLLNNKLVVQH